MMQAPINDIKYGIIDISYHFSDDRFIEIFQNEIDCLHQSLQKPLRKNSMGLVISESAAVMILEREEHALHKSLFILGEIENMNSQCLLGFAG